MPDSVLSADPKLIRVGVGPHPDASTPGVWCEACTLSMLGFTPITVCVLIEVEDEFLPINFFSDTVAGLVEDALGDLGHSPLVGVTFAPVAQDTTVWNPETNAPYP